MSDFSGIDLAIGSVRGWRDWVLTTDGVLTPVTHRSGGEWLPGENVATCQAYVHKKQIGEQGDLSDAEYAEKRAHWKRTHTMDECEHGFYAYFDGSHQMYSTGPRIRGVIEGFGEVLIGTKGFRASKAKILAVCITPFEGMWKLDPFFIDRLKANYPGVAFYESELAMRAEFPCPEWAVADELAGVLDG